MEPEAPPAPEAAPTPRVKVRQPRSAWVLGLFGSMFGVLALDPLLSHRHVGALAAVCAAASLVSLVTAAWHWRGRLVEGEITADERGVGVGALRFARADLSDGMAIPGSTPKVQLTTRSGLVLEATVASLDEADALLDRVALDSGRRALRFPGRSLWKQAAGALGGVMIGSYVGFYLAILLVATGWPVAVTVGTLLSLVFGAMGAVSTRPIEVRVGTDGITLRGAFKTRFIPFAELSGVGENSGDPMLYYRDGRTEVIWNSAVSRQPDLMAALQHRVNGALAANAQHDGLMARAAVLARQGRPLVQWQAEVARAVDPARGYRDAGLSRGDAEAVLDDARSPVEHRIAAAMALRALDAAEAPTRVRVAAAGCASPEVREALEEAGDGTLDEATVSRAVAAVEKGRGWT